VTDFQVSVQADSCHGNKASTAKEETSPSIPAAAHPSKHPAVRKEGNDTKWFSYNFKRREERQLTDKSPSLIKPSFLRKANPPFCPKLIPVKMLQEVRRGLQAQQM